ncbi:MAG: ABC-type phosphate/phosphonate transport system substrate-binding protein [Paracoccaceae bacterium]|jgi:ABC-type phosphate/phosphonate transport system substrate-binding protein
MIASLQMYSRPEINEVVLRFWSEIRVNLLEVGIEAPIKLTQDAQEMDVWTDPNLVFSQTCGMPYRKFLHGKVNIVGTPVYDLKNCSPGYYRSCFLVRKTDRGNNLSEFVNKKFAFNDENSQSGFAGPLSHARAKGLSFSNKIQSYSHLMSAQMVALGKADFTAIDAVTWKLIECFDDFSSDLRVLEWTKPETPGLPFITSANINPNKVFTAVEKAIYRLSESDLNRMNLKGILKIPTQHYLDIPDF